MPRIIHRHIRFIVIDRCLRDTRKQYKIHDILNECNRTMMQIYGTTISLRTVQYDISILRKPPFCIELDDVLLRRGIYRYADTSCKRPSFMSIEDFYFLLFVQIGCT